MVSAQETWGSIGGGNVEAVASTGPGITSGLQPNDDITANLSDKAPVEHGVQCCGGEVTCCSTRSRPARGSHLGVGHVGLELARILARHELDLHWSTPGRSSSAMPY